ncbi:MAG: hypothetical protein ABIW46_03205, partial [Acidimicrobiales bacterium]
DLTDAGAVAARPLPRPLDVVARQAHASVPNTSVAISLAAQGHVVSFTSPDGPDEQRHLAVGTHRGGPQDLDVLRWFYGPMSRPVTVAGQEGLLVTLPGSRFEECRAGPDGRSGSCGATASPLTSFVAAWSAGERVVVVSSTGVTEEELLSAAASITGLDAQTWGQLQAVASVRQQRRRDDESGSGTVRGPATTAVR